MAMKVKLSDGHTDYWGASYILSVLENIGDFDRAVATLSEVIVNLERYQTRLDPLAEQTQDLWDDFWHTERLVEGIKTCKKDQTDAINKLKTARDDLRIFTAACRWCANSGNLGHMMATNKDYSYNC